jgi:hypothetical protein
MPRSVKYVALLSSLPIAFSNRRVENLVSHLWREQIGPRICGLGWRWRHGGREALRISLLALIEDACAGFI